MTGFLNFETAVNFKEIKNHTEAIVMCMWFKCSLPNLFLNKQVLVALMLFVEFNNFPVE